jgi:hypothetical protein
MCTCTILLYIVTWGRSKGWLDHQKISCDIDEELSYGQFLMELVTTKISKC